MKIYRQGDVLLMKIEEIPAGADKVKRENLEIILAHGEATNHTHAIASMDATLFMTKDSLERFLRVDKTVRLRHQEHDTIIIEPGDWKVIQQKEYHPEEIRNVAD